MQAPYPNEPVRTMRNTPAMLNGLVCLCMDVPCNYRGEAVEVGSFAGESADVLSRFFKYVHCVDPWEKLDNIDYSKADGAMHAEAMFDVRHYLNPNIVKHKMSSSVAARAFATDGRKFDLVYIDANHDYDSVSANIAEWLPLIREGGFIAGHDYTNPGTPGVPKAFDKLLGLQNRIGVYEDMSCLFKA